MSESEQQIVSNLPYYASIFSGLLLTISEALPYLTKVKGNGIIQVLINAYGQYGEKKKQEQEQEQAQEKKTEQKIDEILVRLEELKNLVKHEQSNSSNPTNQ
jgi:hypothetical protein